MSAAPWDDSSIQWRDFDRVVLRSCWNYHLEPRSFASWLDAIERYGVPLQNRVDVVRANMHKSYLLALAAAGVPTVPTLLVPRGGSIVMKPAISATAYKTSRMAVDDDVLVQPFIEEVVRNGEWSLVFFDGVFSHSVIKRAATGDFRVQNDFGGSADTAAAPESTIALAQHALRTLPAMPTYARVDCVVTEHGPLLMELELIEPVLFLERSANAADAFADAILSGVRA